MDVLVTEDCAVEAALGTVVTLRLPETATSGYVWSLVEVGAGLRVESERSLPGAGAPGAAGVHEVACRVEQPGSWPVLLRQRRPWEAEAVQERRVVVVAR